jgi:hypothetical protein
LGQHRQKVLLLLLGAELLCLQLLPLVQLALEQASRISWQQAGSSWRNRCIYLVDSSPLVSTTAERTVQCMAVACTLCVSCKHPCACQLHCMSLRTACTGCHPWPCKLTWTSLQAVLQAETALIFCAKHAAAASQ